MGSQQTIGKLDHLRSLQLAVQLGIERAKEIASYEALVEAFSQDDVFREGGKLGGFWGSVYGVLLAVVPANGRVRRRGVTLDLDGAITAALEMRSLLASDTVEYGARARILGLRITSKTIELTPEITLARLNMAERNARQPILTPFSGGAPFSYQWMQQHKVEATTTFSVAVDRTEENAFFSVGHRAFEEATRRFDVLKRTLQLHGPGQVRIGPIDLVGGITPVGRPAWEQPFGILGTLVVRPADVQAIRRLWGLSAGEHSDQTLQRALARFDISGDRADPAERLVDLVIAWEAILLTQKGSATPQELSYRFAVNGSSLLATVGSEFSRRELFRRMRGAYKVRSAVVHGLGDEALKKSLISATVNNMEELTMFLGTAFRMIVVWLQGLPLAARPYRADGGWEALLWPE